MSDGIVIGIDNGISGGLVALGPAGHIIAMRPMPTVKEDGVNRIDVVALNAWLLLVVNIKPDTRIVCERPVGSKSVNAAKSMEASFNSVRAVALLLGLRFTGIVARKWQKAMLAPGDTKAQALIAANQIWPDETFVLPRCKVPNSGLVDAALIAEHARLHSK